MVETLIEIARREKVPESAFASGIVGVKTLHEFLGIDITGYALGDPLGILHGMDHRGGTVGDIAAGKRHRGAWSYHRALRA